MLGRRWLGSSKGEGSAFGRRKVPTHPDTSCFHLQMTIWECAGRKWGLTLFVVAHGWTGRPPTQSAVVSMEKPGAWTVPSALPRTQVLPLV